MKRSVIMTAIGLVVAVSAAAGCSSTASETTGAQQDAAVASASASAVTAAAPAASAAGPSCADGGVCAFGDTGPGGGLVFYVASSPFSAPGTACGDTCMYLETPPNDSSGPMAWCAGPGAASGFSVDALGTAIGTGWLNTQAMLGTTNSPPAVICTSGAAQAASTPIGGLTDWYLPSHDELQTLMDAVQGGDLCLKYGCNFTATGYWSSTQASGKNNSTAYCFGKQMGICSKTDMEAVHAIRAF